MTRLNGHHPAPTPILLVENHYLRRENAALKERLATVYQSKCELEETLAAERQIWRMREVA